MDDASVINYENTIILMEHEAYQRKFDKFYRYAMRLIEESAYYIDTKGKRLFPRLPDDLRALYSYEAMRMSTRLMQIAAWFLLHRARREKEMSAEQVAREKAKLSFQSDTKSKIDGNWEHLPLDFRQLVEKTLRLEARICLLDQEFDRALENNKSLPIFEHLDRIKAVFNR